MTAARVCVVGSVNADLCFRVPALPRPGQTALASSMTSSPGGKGGNQAIAAARAGADVRLVAALGDDPAAGQLRTHLRANGVGLDGVVTVPGPSGSAAENAIVVAPGANAHLSVASSVVREVIDAADVVVVNQAEAAEWHWPVAHLVITRGARGASYLADGERFAIPAPVVEAVDTTGAGDVFAGVLAAHWHSGHENAWRRACAAGALATLVPGAGNCAPSAEAVDDALR